MVLGRRRLMPVVSAGVFLMCRATTRAQDAPHDHSQMTMPSASSWELMQDGVVFAEYEGAGVIISPSVTDYPATITGIDLFCAPSSGTSVGDLGAYLIDLLVTKFLLCFGRKFNVGFQPVGFNLSRRA